MTETVPAAASSPLMTVPAAYFDGLYFSSKRQNETKTAVRTHRHTGSIQGLSTKLRKDAKGAYNMRIGHWLRLPNGQEQKHHILNIEFKKSANEKQLEVHDVRLFNKQVSLDYAQLQKLLSQTQSIFSDINERHLPDNLNAISGWKKMLAEKERESSSLPKLSADGSTLVSGDEDVWTAPLDIAAKQAWRFPKRYLPSVLSFHEEWKDDSPPLHGQVVGFDKKDNMVSTAFTVANHPKGGVHVNISVKQPSKDGQKEISRSITTLRLVPDGKDKDYLKVKSCSILGETISMDDPTRVSRSLMAIAAMISDIHHHKAIPDVRGILEDKGVQDLSEGRKRRVPKTGALAVQSLSGNNYYPLAFGGENKIGANGIRVTFTPFKQKKPYTILIDNGISTLDWKKYGYEGVFPDMSPYLRHRTDETHQNLSEKTAFIETHRHFDHDAGHAPTYKQGYYADLHIATEKTYDASARNFNASRVPKAWFPHYKIIDPHSKFTLFKDIKVKTFALPHSTPNLGLRIETPAGSVGFLGDFYLNPSTPLNKTNGASGATPEQYMKPEDILKKYNGVDMMMIESTRVLSEGWNTTLDEVQTYWHKTLNDHPDKRFIVSAFSTKEDFIVGICEEAAKAGKTVVVDGARMVETYGWLNKHMVYDPVSKQKIPLKDHVKALGGDIVRAGTKAGRGLLNDEDPAIRANTLVLATGPTDEFFSTMYKLARDEHSRFKINPLTDVCVTAQSKIPGTKKGVHSDVYDDQAERLTKFIGVPIITPYVTTLPNSEKHPIYSGHSSRKNLEFAINKIDCQYWMPIHGEKAQHAAMKELIQAAGKTYVEANNQTLLDVEKGKKPKYAGQGKEGYVYFLTDKPDGVVKSVTEYSTYTPTVRFHGLKESMLNTLSEASVRSGKKLKDSNTTPPYQDPHIRKSLFEESIIPGLALDNLGIVQEVFLDIEGTDKNRHNFICTQFAAKLKSKETGETKEVEFYQKVPPYSLISPIACVVTDKNPQDLRKTGDNSLAFAYQVYNAVMEPPTDENGKKKVKIIDENGTRELLRKNLIVYHNGHKFDKPMLEDVFMKAGYPNYRMTKSGKALFYDTLPTSRVYAIFKPDEFKTIPNPDTGMPSFRLTDLITANNLNSQKAHDAVNDNNMCQEVYDHQEKIDKELKEWLIVNAHSRTLKNYLLGTGRGFRWNKPIVSYLGYTKPGYEARMGYTVTLEHTHTKGNKAILFRLDKDPEEMAQLSNEELEKNFDDYFDVVPLNNQPGIIPGKYGLAVDANKGLSQATLLSRKYFIENNPALIIRIRNAASVREQSKMYTKDPILPDELDRKPSYTPLEKAISSKDDKMLKSSVQPQNWMIGATKKDMLGHMRHVNHLRQNNTYDKTTRRLLTHMIYTEARHLLKNDQSALQDMETLYRYHDKGPTGGVYISRERVQLEINELEENIDKWRVQNPRVDEIIQACKEDFAAVTAVTPGYAPSLPQQSDIQRRNREKLDKLQYK